MAKFSRLEVVTKMMETGMVPLFYHSDVEVAKKTLKVPVSDYTNGYRIYSKRAAKHVVETCGAIGDGFIILSEILVELYYNGFKISEIKTVWKNRVKGKSTVGLKEITASLIGLMRIYKKIDQIKHKNLK